MDVIWCNSNFLFFIFLVKMYYELWAKKIELLLFLFSFLFLFLFLKKFR